MKRTILCKTLIATALIGATIVGTNALAGPTGEQDHWTFYYLVQNPVTNRCMVVDTKPTPDGVQAIAYESRAQANRALTEAAAYDVPDCSSPNDKVISAHVKVTENTSEATGGQTQARDYYLANPVVFGAVTPVISANQTAAALADGSLEGPVALPTAARRAGVVLTLVKAPR